MCVLVLGYKATGESDIGRSKLFGSIMECGISLLNAVQEHYTRWSLTSQISVATGFVGGTAKNMADVSQGQKYLQAAILQENIFE